MSRSYEELNALEQLGLMKILKKDGWSQCIMSNVTDGDRPVMTKQIWYAGIEKTITVELNNFYVDED